MRGYLLLISILLFIWSCKDEPPQKFQTEEFNFDSRGVWVLNEGNFRSANASITVHFPDITSEFHYFYSNANERLPLGDVAQSMSKINEEYWVVVNNSGKIEVLNDRGRANARIEGLSSPRYCIQGPNDKVYVSDLYQNVVYVVDAVSKSIVGQIPCQGWTEEMEIVGDKLFVCQVDSNQILVINTQNDSIEQRIPTSKHPLSMVLDQNNMLWVGCSGGVNDAEPALMKINPTNAVIELDLRVSDISKSISELALSPNGSQIYYLMEDVFKMDVNATSLPLAPWHSQPAANYYAMGVDPTTGEVYLSDAIDYQQDGAIYRLDSEANYVSQFKAGLIPGFFYFEEP